MTDAAKTAVIIHNMVDFELGALGFGDTLAVGAAESAWSFAKIIGVMSGEGAMWLSP